VLRQLIVRSKKRSVPGVGKTQLGVAAGTRNAHLNPTALWLFVRLDAKHLVKVVRDVHG
jgi:hypothetical protein